MATVVRLGPLPLGHRCGSRIAELERILRTPVQLVEAATLDEFVIAVGTPDVIAVVLDAPRPGELSAAVDLPARARCFGCSGRQRNTRGEVDEVFNGYGLLTETGVVGLADGELSAT